MTPQEILTPVILLLAFVGYVTCLVRFFALSVAASSCLAFLLSFALPFSSETRLFWYGAAGVVSAALLVAFFVSRSAPAAPRKRPAATPRKEAASDRSEVVVDGTNVLFWGGEPHLGTLRSVVDQLKHRGFAPFVFLDASSRHHLGDTSLDEKGFSKALGLPRNQIMVCPAQTEADAFILKFAKERRLPIVSNDRFGDRAKQAKGLKLIKGGIAKGKPMLHGV